jgi:phosphate transport system permease protein
MVETSSAPAPGVVTARSKRNIDIRKSPRWNEAVVRTILTLCGLLSVGTTIGIVFVLGTEAWKFFGNPEVSLGEFFGSTRWAPEAGLFGIWGLVSATLTTSLVAMLVAIPVGLAAAIFLSEYASPSAAKVLKPVLELLAGVPTVVYGYFALTFVTPILRNLYQSLVTAVPAIGATLGPEIGVYNMLSAGLVMGVMIIPLVGSISEDALSAVPRALREASFGLGATKLETTLRVVVPAALSGIIAGVIIGVSRAVGETMIVSLASGAGPNFTFNPIVAAETMTGHIARISSGDLSYETIDYASLFAVGLMLFAMTLVLNLISRYFVNRFREVY